MLYEIRQLSFAYADRPVLGAIDLDIDRGGFVSVIGPNGAGKSTLLKLLAGLLRHFGGSVRFGGEPIGSYTPRALARRVAFVPQETHVVFPFTAGEMILMGRHAARRRRFFDSGDDGQTVTEVMNLTETGHLAGRLFGQLSGGERQRVVLASALAQGPEVLLLDEPTVYLDLRHQIDFYETLGGLNRDGLTVVAVTHDVNLAARYASRLVVLSEGRIVADGTPREIVTESLLRETFGVGAHVLERPEGGPYVIATT